MNSPKLLYNNEAIGFISIISVLRHQSPIALNKIPLILPFSLEDDIVKKLKSKWTVNADLNEIMINNIASFLNFNDRFYSFLPKTINIVSLGIEAGLFKLENGFLYLEEEPTIKFSKIGNRGKNIVAASKKLSEILETTTSKLYFTLRIKI